jgi:hypothetical protein
LTAAVGANFMHLVAFSAANRFTLRRKMLYVAAHEPHPG